MADGVKTILVTGASGGIGVAVCHRLAQAGDTLVLAARDLAKLQALSAELSKLGSGRHRCLPVDMTDDGSVEAFGAKLAAEETVLDGAVLMPPQPPKSNDCLPPNETWRKLFQDSFIGPLHLLRHAIAAMQPDPARGKRCKIVIISAISSAQVLGHYAASNVLRSAWRAEAKTLAFALGERGIHVNTLSLGGILTPGYAASLGKRAADAGMTFEKRLGEETSNIPLLKYGRPEEVAVAVEGLLSTFSDHMTGLNILQDGGFTRAY